MITDPEGFEVTALASRLPPLPCRVLEIGCGDGRLTRRYHQRVTSVLAVDTDREALAAFRASAPAANIEIREIAVSDLDLPAGAVDVALFSWAL
jgi:16S rRNA A1518/A1519 N6-dimethyltransferase RsmA/KsgA/DIM1 with predicted DNA glycosylase/AP lyase activity